MPSDLPPEYFDAANLTGPQLTLDEALRAKDVGAQPGPDDLEFALRNLNRSAGARDLSQVTWPADDAVSPDYAYVGKVKAPTSFSLTSDVLESLFAHNRYVPFREDKIIAFALRGAQLKSGHEAVMADRLSLQVVRPDHQNFRCIIGFYYTSGRKLTAFSGSTVPCRLAVWGYANGGEASNLLPAGMHTYYIWRHKDIWPALRMGRSTSDPETAASRTVLRTTRDYKYTRSDEFDLSEPVDNVHCSYFLEEDKRAGASFSSWGCLTVRGDEKPGQQWKKFQEVLIALGRRKRVDLILATGTDAAIIAANLNNKPLLANNLTALRHGSRGNEVKRLQSALGETETGFFGAQTLKTLTDRQRKMNSTAGLGAIADGFYSKAWDTRTGWKVFTS